MIKKLLICIVLLSTIAVSMSAQRVNTATTSRNSKIEESSVFAEVFPRVPVKGGGRGGWKTEETPILAEVLPRIPVKGGGRGGFKNEETPVLLEGRMGPAGSGDGGATSSGKKKKGRGRKNEEMLILAEGFPMSVLLEAHRNLRRFH